MLREGASRFRPARAPGLQLRQATRLCWLALELLLAFISYAVRAPFVSRERLGEVRARWLQRSSRRMLRVLGVRVEPGPVIPRAGLLVCNHLSYLDILVIASLAPARFVSKKEVASWPVFGCLARFAGTVFVDRERRADVVQKSADLQQALDRGGLTVLFPEGTSTGGDRVLPFKSSLLEPAARGDYPLWAGFICYDMDEGCVAEEVCYWGDMTLIPHLVKLAGKQAIIARIRFAQVREGRMDRKQLARRLHDEVARLSESVTAF